MRPVSSLRRGAQFEMSWFAIIGALGAQACGSADHVDVPPVDNSVDASVTSGVNVCPSFQSSLVLPQEISPKESAVVAVRAIDPDGPDSQLVFHWTSASGSFKESDKSVTTYACSKLGNAQLNVTVTDRPGCSATLTLIVDCVGS